MDESRSTRPQSGIPRIHLQLSLRQRMLFQAKNLDQFFAITTRERRRLPLKSNGRRTDSGSSVKASKSMNSTPSNQGTLTEDEPLNNFYSHLHHVEADLEKFYRQTPPVLRLDLSA